MNKKVLWICHAAMIAALYVVLTLCINAFGLASGAIHPLNLREIVYFCIVILQFTIRKTERLQKKYRFENKHNKTINL